MLYFIMSLILFVAVLLVLVVLAQNSKGGGLAAGMGGASQVIGTRRTTDWIEKATWVLAIALFVLCLGLNTVIDTVAAGQNNTNSTPALDKVYDNLPNETVINPSTQSGTTTDSTATQK
ncbi:MAG: hypothetical protein OHK0038_21570 [Flammeovirgaceae bacterium]